MNYKIESRVTFWNMKKSSATAKRLTTDVTIKGPMPEKESLEAAILGDLRSKGKNVLMCEIISVMAV